MSLYFSFFVTLYVRGSCCLGMAANPSLGGSHGQPCQNLGQPQDATCYFATQFEKFPERMEEFWARGKKQRGGVRSIFLQ